MNYNKFLAHALLGLASMLLNFGCMAKLRIGVDVYKGSLINSPESQLGEAVGLAHVAYLAVTKLQSQSAIKNLAYKITHLGTKTGELATLMKSAVESYAGLPTAENGIDALWAKYTSIGHVDPRSVNPRSESSKPDPATVLRDSVNAERVKVRAQLADALYRFGGECEGLGRLRGLPVAINMHKRPLATLLQLSDFRDGVGLEEAGRWIKYLTDSALDTSARTSIARMMQSVTTGHTATMASGSPLVLFHTVDKALDKTYWSEINEINVVGVGKTEYVLVKDEIGNWHIKSLIADQDEIVNAVFDGAEGMVGILAAYYGVSASREAIDDSDVPEVSQSFVNRQLKTAKANRAAGTLSTAKLGLQVALVAAFTETNEGIQRKLLKNAIQTYASQIDGISVEESK